MSKLLFLAILAFVVAWVLMVTIIGFSTPILFKGLDYSTVLFNYIPEELIEATVTRYVDGDTIKVIFDNENVYVRMIGIDTPETVHPFKPIEHYGIEASNLAKTVIGNKVYLSFDDINDKYDKYNRLLAYVWLPYGDKFISYNMLVILNGYGKDYLTYKFNENNMQIYELLGDIAEINGKGLYN